MKYPWPASAITTQDMALLHSVREAASPRTPISTLVAAAIRQTYGHDAATTPDTNNPETPEKRKEAA